MELMTAKFMANIEEKFQQMDIRFEEKLSGQAGVQEEKSGERVTSVTEGGRDEISQSEQLH